MVGILAGLRIGEILGLRWEDVDFATRTLRVEHAVYRSVLGSLKTEGSRRTLPDARSPHTGAGRTLAHTRKPSPQTSVKHRPM